LDGKQKFLDLESAEPSSSSSCPAAVVAYNGLSSPQEEGKNTSRRNTVGLLSSSTSVVHSTSSNPLPIRANIRPSGKSKLELEDAKGGKKDIEEIVIVEKTSSKRSSSVPVDQGIRVNIAVGGVNSTDDAMLVWAKRDLNLHWGGLILKPTSGNSPRKYWLGDLPEELLAITASYLTHQEKFKLCLASSRVVPQMWGVVLVDYSAALKKIQDRCEAQGILTEIASESQILAQEQWWECTQARKMMEEDVRRYDENPPRYETEMEEVVNLERERLNKFQATVGVLAEVMRIWSECCAERDEIAKMCQCFHNCVSTVFRLRG